MPPSGLSHPRFIARLSASHGTFRSLWHCSRIAPSLFDCNGNEIDWIGWEGRENEQSARGNAEVIADFDDDICADFDAVLSLYGSPRDSSRRKSFSIRSPSVRESWYPSGNILENKCAVKRKKWTQHDTANSDSSKRRVTFLNFLWRLQDLKTTIA